MTHNVSSSSVNVGVCVLTRVVDVVDGDACSMDRGALVVEDAVDAAMDTAAEGRLVGGDPLHAREVEECEALRQDSSDLLITGEVIRQMRKAVGMTQAELAAKLNRSKAQVCLWENGRYLMPFSLYQQFYDELAKRRGELASFRSLMENIANWPTAGTWGKS